MSTTLVATPAQPETLAARPKTRPRRAAVPQSKPETPNRPEPGDFASLEDRRIASLWWPDHTELPDRDDTIVQNFQERPQSALLTESILPVLEALHPDGQFIIGQDCGIYWRLPPPDIPLVRNAIAPDWFYIPNVPPKLNDQLRRSYVMWREYIRPPIVIEFVSGDGSEERDRTPVTGKFWIYENAVGPAYYAIYEVNKASVEVYQMVNGRFQLMPPNERGHYLIEPLGAELGIWQGQYENTEFPWLRWWDSEGNLLLCGEERVLLEAQRADQETQRAERLAAQLRALGIEPTL